MLLFHSFVTCLKKLLSVTGSAVSNVLMTALNGNCFSTKIRRYEFHVTQSRQIKCGTEQYRR
jgi:hypothetical protein